MIFFNVNGNNHSQQVSKNTLSDNVFPKKYFHNGYLKDNENIINAENIVCKCIKIKVEQK